MDRLLGLYALVSGAALLFPHRPAAWPLLLVLHALGASVLLGVGPGPGLLARAAGRLPRVARVVRDWYPLLLVPFLYAELAVLNLAVWDGRYFDTMVMGWEEALFGGQPSREWARAVPSLLLSEVLHFGYFSYYGILYLPLLYLYVAGRVEAFRRVVFVVMLSFLAHYVFFIYLPVSGPRYIFPAPTGGIEDGFFYGLVHAVLEAGSSRGAAFPSSHVGVTVAAVLALLRVAPRLGFVLVPLTVALALGTVYGGFHYATDASAGLLLGALCVAAAPVVRRALLPAGRRSG